MNTQEPEPGDEVVLRTGGPVMTVLGSADDDRPRELFCVWFDEQRRRCQGTFHSELLMLVEYATYLKIIGCPVGEPSTLALSR